MGSTLRWMQPTLIHVSTMKDVVYTPRWLAREIVDHFQPSGFCLDPCTGDGAFFECLPAGSAWCEIERGRDFYAWTEPVDWVISNPPYSHLLSWIRHSFAVASNIVYLVPLHRVMGSEKFLRDVVDYGGLKEIFTIGTGTSVGFPFGHALVAVHYRRDWHGGTMWSQLGGAESRRCE